VVKTRLNTAEVRDYIKAGAGDAALLVLGLSGEAAWRGLSEADSTTNPSQVAVGRPSRSLDNPFFPAGFTSQRPVAGL